MFDKQYRFKGRHAYRADMLTNIIDPITKFKVFNRNIDVYINAPLIGFLYNRKAELDSLKNPETNQVYDESIFDQQIINASEHLTFNYQLIMLLDKNYEPDEEARINKAFRNIGKDKQDEELFDSYVRGGVDVLYEKILENAGGDTDKIINNLYDFMDDFNEMFNKTIDANKLISLCANN